MKNNDMVACLLGVGFILAGCSGLKDALTAKVPQSPTVIDTIHVASIDAFAYPIEVYKYRDSLVTCIITDHGTSGASVSCVGNK